MKNIVLGRSRDCDVIVDDPTVSARHLRMSWEGNRILVEDLGSANGTFVGGERITRAHIRPGDSLRLGTRDLSWSLPELRAFLRSGAGQTLLAQDAPKLRPDAPRVAPAHATFVCASCGSRGSIPASYRGKNVRCGVCGKPHRRRGWAGRAFAVLLLVGLVAGGGFALWHFEIWPTEARRLAEEVISGRSVVGSPQEASIRSHSAARIVAAMDSSSAVTRNEAAQLAASAEGPFRVEQVATIWSHVRQQWRYVNDPRGAEYFAAASETISNEYVGDCDDFAIVLAAMLRAVGGEARIVMMDGPEGGHAYAEVFVPGEGSEIRTRLVRHYRSLPRRERRTIRDVHFRPTDEGIWLNLDWNAGVPGGPYEAEDWAVAIYDDGRTETLVHISAGGQGDADEAATPP